MSACPGIPCPVCGGEARVITEGPKGGEVRTLRCLNDDCQAKKIRAYDLFVSRDALNIEGLSESTLEKLIGRGFVLSFADLFRLDRHRDEMKEMEGFGELSVNNLIDSAARASSTTLTRLIYGLGVPGIGLANAKLLVRHFNGSLEALMSASEEELSNIRSIGPVLAASVRAYFDDRNNRDKLADLLSCLTIEPENLPEESASAGGKIAGKTFVITGSLMHYRNRRELQNVIESLGGRVTGSVTANTDYLINNDNMSSSTKNRTAAKLGIPVITEDAFREMTQNAD